MAVQGKAIARPLFFGIGGTLFGVLLAELIFALVWRQENVYLYEYKNGYVYNRPGFNDEFAMVPTASLEQLRRKLPAFFSRSSTRHGQVFKRRIVTNALGQRDDREPSFERADNRYRILNLGDSMGFGWPVSPQETYLSQLEKKLSNVETINCSVIANNTAQLATVYEKECAKFKSDLVIIQITVHKDSTDPDYIGRDPLGPDYRLIKALWRTYGNRAISSIRWDEDGVPHLELGSTAQLERALKQYFEPRLPLYFSSNLVRFVENRWLASPLNLGGGDFLTTTLSKTQLRSPAAKIGATLKYLDRLNGAIRRNGASALVFFTPTSFRARNLDKPRPELDLLKSELQRRNIEYVDFGETLREPASPAVDTLYYSEDYHPNEQGYRLMAEALAKKITGLFR